MNVSYCNHDCQMCYVARCSLSVFAVTAEEDGQISGTFCLTRFCMIQLMDVFVTRCEVDGVPWLEAPTGNLYLNLYAWSRY